MKVKLTTASFFSVGSEVIALVNERVQRVTVTRSIACMDSREEAPTVDYSVEDSAGHYHKLASRLVAPDQETLFKQISIQP